jgi:hypothetical protein
MATTQTGVNGQNAMLNAATDFRHVGDPVQTLWLQVVDKNVPSMDLTLNRKLASGNPAKVRDVEIFQRKVDDIPKTRCFSEGLSSFSLFSLVKS